MAKKSTKKVTMKVVENKKPKQESWASTGANNLQRELLKAGGDISKTESFGKDVMTLNKTTGQRPTQDSYQKAKEEQDALIIKLWNKSDCRESNLREVVLQVFRPYDIYGSVVESKYRKHEQYVRQLLSLPETEDRWLGPSGGQK